MRAKTFATSLSTTLIVAAVASIWAVASPMASSCASAYAGDQVAAASGESAAFVSAINQVRAAKGLAALVVDGNLTSVAQGWAQQMGQAEGISHRPNLAAGVTIDWKLLGENVGRAPEVGQMMEAFVASPTHYNNMVNGSFTHIGVGTVRTPDGLLYSAHEFASVRTAAAPSPAPAPAPAPAPKPVVAAAPSTTATPAPAVTAAAPSTTAAPATTVPAETTVERAPSTSGTGAADWANNAKPAAVKTNTGGC